MLRVRYLINAAPPVLQTFMRFADANISWIDLRFEIKCDPMCPALYMFAEYFAVAEVFNVTSMRSTFFIHFPEHGIFECLMHLQCPAANLAPRMPFIATFTAAILKKVPARSIVTHGHDGYAREIMTFLHSRKRTDALLQPVRVLISSNRQALGRVFSSLQARPKLHRRAHAPLRVR